MVHHDELAYGLRLQMAMAIMANAAANIQKLLATHSSGRGRQNYPYQM
jgi:hypothetical protein